MFSAVAFHHWRDNFHNILLGTDKEFKRAVDIIIHNNKLKNNLLENLKNHFNDNSFSNYIDMVGFNDDIVDIMINGSDLFTYLLPPYYGYFLPQRLAIDEECKKKWICTAGLLMRIDHFTSFVQDEGISEDIEKPAIKYAQVQNNVRNHITTNLGRNGIKNKRYLAD